MVGGEGVCSPSAVVTSGGEREGGVVSSACRGGVSGCIFSIRRLKFLDNSSVFRLGSDV